MLILCTMLTLSYFLAPLLRLYVNSKLVYQTLENLDMSGNVKRLERTEKFVKKRLKPKNFLILAGSGKFLVKVESL